MLKPAPITATISTTSSSTVATRGCVCGDARSGVNRNASQPAPTASIGRVSGKRSSHNGSHATIRIAAPKPAKAMSSAGRMVATLVLQHAGATTIMDARHGRSNVPPRRRFSERVAAKCQEAARTATAAPSKPGFGCVITCTAMRRM